MTTEIAQLRNQEKSLREEIAALEKAQTEKNGKLDELQAEAAKLCKQEELVNARIAELEQSVFT